MRGKWLNGAAVLVIYVLLMMILSVVMRVDLEDFQISQFILVQVTSMLVAVVIGYPLQLGCSAGWRCT